MTRIARFRWLTTLALLTAATGWAAEPEKSWVTTWIARMIDEVPFINGGLNIPSFTNTNNRGTITQQTVPGITHMEAYLYWRYLEPEKNQWNGRELEEMLALCQSRDLKMLVLPWVMYAPEWFKKTADFQPLVEMKTGHSVDMLSPWAPGTLVAFDHFYAELAKRYKSQIGIIKLGYPGSDFGEVGLTVGSKAFLPGGNFAERIPQDPENWKRGYWCGDPAARADFRERMLSKYGGSLEKLNAAWKTQFASTDAIEFPDPDHRADSTIRWLDFITWLRESQTRNMVKLLRVIRKHFPETLLDIPLGFGSDLPSDACDRTAICRAAAEFKPINVRSTHGSVNRERIPRAYWFYKRMAPVCHDYGIGFGTEPPGGNLTTEELLRQYFEDASAGANFIFHYFQNYHRRPNVVGDYKRILRPQERSLVDIGVLYPTTQMILDMSPAPEGQWQFCAEGREFFDYDLVDENMVEWGLLKNYKVLVHTSGKVLPESTLAAISKWLEAGGILITRGEPKWQTPAGQASAVSGWVAQEETMKDALPAVRAYRVGKGRLYVAAVAKIPEYLTRVDAILDAQTVPLHGFNRNHDGKYVTDFPDGRLLFNPQTRETVFIAPGAPPMPIISR
ncbi:hypothetical protein CfE428DRAFT_0804 [Chthoniobacter flavus Ellin428]|uniref:Glycoside hydrolase family 42 N-terminal domain-containing protein n=1 Tax=Chthoniobacter flavus Ellin428 TaxID=497964 RepID=B4CVW7_9BACT|nr:hypothetical protein [Chthoniobacter flavus]EDY21559.1 hypothetical protein CfE428DRAFT_0804 [Chthoniobacter flavus Ellin428]TCO95502.1 hypothetical protein EV701_101189 [Chthoniobacter flavus]